MSLPTVKVRDPLNSDDYIIINESGYDPVSMTLWGEKPVRPTVKIYGPDGPEHPVVINEIDFDPKTMVLWDGPKVEAKRKEAILDATRLVMDSGDTENLIASGAPKVPVLEEILGYDITADERDVAWKVCTDE